jgi:hypothetical protein
MLPLFHWAICHSVAWPLEERVRDAPAFSEPIRRFYWRTSIAPAQCATDFGGHQGNLVRSTQKRFGWDRPRQRLNANH